MASRELSTISSPRRRQNLGDAGVAVLALVLCVGCVELFPEPPDVPPLPYVTDGTPSNVDAEDDASVGPDVSPTPDAGPEQDIVCGDPADDLEAPCNGCPAGTVVPLGWVCIPAGEFEMGAPPGEPGRVDDEGPVFSVVITRPFLIQAQEMTQREWAASAIGMAAYPSYFRRENGRPCTQIPFASPSCPVERVNWYEAVAMANTLSRIEGREPCYDQMAINACEGVAGQGCPSEENCVETVGDECAVCNSSFDCQLDAFDEASIHSCTGYRLPTEAEWEYAARAGTTGPYSSANSTDTFAWCDGDGGEEVSTSPAGRLAPNDWGLYDVHGNVWEWVQDDYVERYPNNPLEDPLSLVSGDDVRVARGGAFGKDPLLECRSASRFSSNANTAYRDVGFRLVRTLPQIVRTFPQSVD